MEIIIRRGRINDKEWICRLLREGAQFGHYSTTVGAQASGLFDAILHRGAIDMLKVRDGVQMVSAISTSLLIAEMNGRPAAFLISLADGKEVELHLAGTIKAYRRKGCFRQLIRAESGAHRDARVFARCYKKSTWATSALVGEGFQVSKLGDPIELTLMR